MRASLTEAETRFCHEKVGSPIKSKRGTTRAGPFLSATLPETSGKFGRRGRGRANPGSDDVVEESVERWREAVPRDADGLKNLLLLARCK